MHSTLFERLQALSQSHANSTALIEPDRQTTFAQLTKTSGWLAGHLHARGLRAGDRVALWLPNGLEWLQCFLACAQLGATALSVNTRFRSHEVQDVIERGHASWLIYWPEFKGIAFNEILADIPADVLAKLKGSLTHAQIQALCETPIESPPAHGDHGTLTFTTSGTTSLPKFVLHTQSTILRHAEAVAATLGYDSQSRVLASAPFCGAFGFATLAGGLLNGHAVVCEPVSTAQSLRDLIRDHQVTHTYANNALILQVLESSTSPGDFKSCQLFGFASFAPAMNALFDLAKQHNITLCGLYGSSEMQALLAIQPVDSAQGDTTVQFEPGGRLTHPSGRVRARDPETGHLVALGESGELEILCPSHMSAYMDQPEATRKVFTEDGYFKTGDLGWCVSDRQFVFQARMGDSLRLAGFLVNPSEIEQVIESLPGISACQVVAANQGDKTVTVAFVTLTESATANPHDWYSACKRRLAGFKVPAHFEVLESFPTVESANSVKIQKHRLREMAQDILNDKQ